MRKEGCITMKYEKPNAEIIEFEADDIVCVSPGLEVGDNDNDDQGSDWN